jgi:CRP-like cAMP-binding protein
MQFISPNELLTALPPVIYERLALRLQRVRLKVGSILFDVGATIDYTWFIASGIVSLPGATEDGIVSAKRREKEKMCPSLGGRSPLT